MIIANCLYFQMGIKGDIGYPGLPGFPGSKGEIGEKNKIKQLIYFVDF